MQQRKCQGCKQQLDLPSVHFMCGHSYHKVLDWWGLIKGRIAWICPKKHVPIVSIAISTSFFFSVSR